MSASFSSLFDNAKKVTLVNVTERKEEIIEPPKKKLERTEDSAEDDEEDDEEEEEEEDDEEDDPAALNSQTIFVGNVPSGCTQKELKKLFSEFGTIQSIRLRNLIPLHPKRGNRLAFIKKEFHPLQKTVTAFVRFADPMEAQSATSLNGFLYQGHHLRVDMAHAQQEEVKHDYKRSLFIGNLPFDAKDDDVWEVFQECGEIESVRLVRDRATSVGKGFGYVLFKDEASVALAMRMNGNCKIGRREIRIKAAVKKPKVPKAYPTYTKPAVRRMAKARHSREPAKVQEGRVEKRPAIKLKKELQKKKKRALKTNDTRKDFIQLKKRTS